MQRWDALAAASANAHTKYRGRSARSPRRGKKWFDAYESTVRHMLESPVHMVRHNIAATPSKFLKTAYMPYVNSMEMLWTTSDWTDLDATLAATKRDLKDREAEIILYHTGHEKLDKVAFDVRNDSIRVPVVDMGGISAIKFDANRQQDMFVFESADEATAFNDMNLSETEQAQLRDSVRRVYGDGVTYKKCTRKDATTRYLIRPKDLSRALKNTVYKAAHYWDFSNKVGRRYTSRTPWVIAVQTTPEFRITWNVTPRNAPEYALL